jgi:hypothetical protein
MSLENYLWLIYLKLSLLIKNEIKQYYESVNDFKLI